MLSLSLLAVVLAQSPELDLANRPKVPPFVPRSVGLGLLLRDGAISSMLRLGWEIDLIDQPRNRFIVIAEAGGAISLTTPKPLRFLHQESLILGLGYRYNNGRLHWGLHAGVGPVFYGGTFETGTRESRVWLTIEGRLQLGVNLGPVAVAGFFGISTLPDYDDRFRASLFLGGFLVGVLVNWR